MRNQTYQEQLEAAYNRARKAKNAEAMKYYAEKMGITTACVSFERFKGSWAYAQWIKNAHNCVLSV
jgi:hypothetical protein